MKLAGLSVIALMKALIMLFSSQAHGATYQIKVDAGREVGKINRFWQESIGSERMYNVLDSHQGVNQQSAYALAAKELGMKTVRGHGILNDDVGIYSEQNGQPRYDWTNFDKIMDYILSTGMKPLVEFSFMPSALASGTATFGWYGGWSAKISPPKDYDKWRDLAYNVAKHAIERYGASEVESWYWEIWNEPDLDQFFSGTQNDYFRMYDYAVEGLLQASPNLKVGGPSVAIIGNGWIEAFIDHCMNENFANPSKGSTKLDFISWHKYPYPDIAHAEDIPSGQRHVHSIIQAKKAQYPQLNVLNFLTEWNTSFTGGNSYNNEIGASFVAKAVHGMFADQNGVPPPDRAAFWVLSDVWEEWDATWGLAFGPMGLVMRRHDVRKPPYLAFRMLAMMHNRQLSFTGGTTSPIGLNGFATMSDNSKQVQVLLYNHNYGDGEVSPPVADQVVLQVDGLPFEKNIVTVQRFGVDRQNNNAFTVWDAAERPNFPSEEQWLQMKEAGQLKEIQPAADMNLTGAGITLQFEQLQPGVSLLLITEQGAHIPPPGVSDGTGGTEGPSAPGGAPPNEGNAGSDVSGNSPESNGSKGPLDGSESTANGGGCGCRVGAGTGGSMFGLLLVALLLATRRWRDSPEHNRPN